MKNTSPPTLEIVLAMFQTLPTKDKETLFQQLAQERTIPQWQIDLVRKRKAEAEKGKISWVDGNDFLKILD